MLKIKKLLNIKKILKSKKFLITQPLAHILKNAKTFYPFET